MSLTACGSFKPAQHSRRGLGSTVCANCHEPAHEHMTLPCLQRYPEFKPLIKELANKVCREINDRAPQIESPMIYKPQLVLEELIKELQGRV